MLNIDPSEKMYQQKKYFKKPKKCVFFFFFPELCWFGQQTQTWYPEGWKFLKSQVLCNNKRFLVQIFIVHRFAISCSSTWYQRFTGMFKSIVLVADSCYLTRFVYKYLWLLPRLLLAVFLYDHWAPFPKTSFLFLKLYILLQKKVLGQKVHCITIVPSYISLDKITWLKSWERNSKWNCKCFQLNLRMGNFFSGNFMPEILFQSSTFLRQFQRDFNH